MNTQKMYNRRKKCDSYKKLCEELECTKDEIIIGNTKEDTVQRQLHINRIKQFYDIEEQINYHPNGKIKRVRYVILPNFSKKQDDKNLEQQQYIEQGLLIPIINTQGKQILINALNNQAYSFTEIEDYLLYIALHSRYINLKSQLFTLMFYPLTLWDKIYNDYYIYSQIDGFQKLLDTYDLFIIQQSEKIIFNRLRKFVNKKLKEFEQDNKISIMTRYVVGNKFHTVTMSEDEIIILSQEAVDKINKDYHTGFTIDDIELNDKFKDIFRTIRNQKLSKHIQHGDYNYIDKLNDNFEIKYKEFHISPVQDFLKSDKCINLTIEQQRLILFNFLQVFRARLLYKIKHYNIVIYDERPDKYMIGTKLFEEIYQCCKPLLNFNTTNYIDPIDFQLQNLPEHYNTTVITRLKEGKGKLTKISKINQARWNKQQQFNKWEKDLK